MSESTYEQETSSTKPFNYVDQYIAIATVAVTVVTMLVVFIMKIINSYSNSSKSCRAVDEEEEDISLFKLSNEKDEYIQLKDDIGDKYLETSNLEKLRRLLIKRAFKTCHIIHVFERESTDTEVWRRKGMLSNNKKLDNLKAKKLILENEMSDVKDEADVLFPGWSEIIWQHAFESYNLHKSRTKKDDTTVEDTSSNSTQQ